MIKNLKIEKALSSTKFFRKSGAGFTLIETLVVLIVIIVVGSIILGVVFSSLRTSNKANSLDVARTNGNYAIGQMGKMIRYAKSFEGVSSDNNPYGNYNANCIPVTITPIPITDYHYVKITSFDGGQTIFSCTNTEIASISATNPFTPPVNLVDPNAVIINNCTITCQQASRVTPPTITVSFDLSKKTGGVIGNFTENRANVSFQTSVTLRNYQSN